MSEQEHWEAVYGQKPADRVSWYRPHLERSLAFVGGAGLAGDAAIETADVALMSDDLSKLPWLVAHSRRTVAIMRENITFSLLVKVVFVVLTFAGRATLWSAITADMGASLLVILNALRLLRARSWIPAQPN